MSDTHVSNSLFSACHSGKVDIKLTKLNLIVSLLASCLSLLSRGLSESFRVWLVASLTTLRSLLFIMRLCILVNNYTVDRGYFLLDKLVLFGDSAVLTASVDKAA